MKAKLFSIGNFLGYAKLPETRDIPKVIYLDESPQGGQRVFVYKGPGFSDHYGQIVIEYDEVTGVIPIVRLEK